MADLDRERRKMVVARAVAALLMFAASAAGASCWASGWTDVTPRNGVWDEYYRRTDDPGGTLRMQRRL